MSSELIMVKNKKNEWAFKKHFRGLNRVLFLWFIIISLIPMTVLTVVSLLNARASLKNDAIQSLNAIIKLKKDYFAAYFSERLNDINLQSDVESNIELIKKLREAFLKSEVPLSEFINTSAWRDITEEYSVDISDFAAIYGYHDVLLIDVDGDILFSVMGEDDLGTNIFTDAYADTPLSKACWETLETGLPVAGDLDFYEPANNALVLFLVRAMFDMNGEQIGVLAFKMPIHQINDIMQDTTGLGKTGHTYLVGSDMRMRSDWSIDEPSMLVDLVDTEIIKNWLKEVQKIHSRGLTHDDGFDSDVKNMPIIKSGYFGPHGNKVLGAYSRLDTLERLGLIWALVAEVDIEEAFKPATTLWWMVFVLANVTGFFVICLSYFLTRKIVIPIRELSEWAKRVAIGDLKYSTVYEKQNEIGELSSSFKQVVDSLQEITQVCGSIAIGDYSKTVKIRSREDYLGISVNKMAENLRAVVRQANAVANGNYSTEIVPKSDKDELEIALLNMTTKLSEMSDEHEKQAWIKEGYNELYNIMRGEQDLETLSNNITIFLANYLNSYVGALYVVEDEALIMRGSYAVTGELGLFGRGFLIGEGLVGETARDGKPIIIDKVPADYIKIDSGLGKTTPHSLAIVPFFFADKVNGVIELGAFYRFSDLQMDFLKGALENIGIAVNSAKSRSQMKELLEHTREQANKLKMQQAELWKTNDVLEERTKALEESEKHLQIQQEELRVANEELEERTQALQKQRDAIRLKNEELKKAQEVIRIKARDLELANKYKSEFLANMSHELRTPLNSILILSQLLSSQNIDNLNEKQIEYAETIHSSGTDLLNIINEILDLAKVEAGKMDLHVDTFDINDLTSGIDKMFRHVAEKKGLKFTILIEGGAPEAIRTDSQRLQQIIRNLVSNAIKFTIAGGVTLSIGAPEPDVDLAKSGLQHADAFVLTVADTGIGIPDDKKDMIFEAFQQADGTTSRQYGGTGLGLSISREFAKFLGGELRMKSQEGEGSEFQLYLPIDFDVKAAAGDRELKSEPVSESALEKVVKPKNDKDIVVQEKIVVDDRLNVVEGDNTLLIIEDDKNFAKILVDQANARGFKCYVAEDGETGLHFADFYNPNAIILDIGLPGISGWEVMERLKENPDTRHVPVHIMSAKDKSIEAMQMGAIGFLTKPIDLKKINQALGNIEHMALRPVKKLLVVEDDDVQRKSIIELIGNGDVESSGVATGEEAYNLLLSKSFDCMILDLGLKDMTGFALLEKIKKSDDITNIPIIVYTGKELSHEEEAGLQRYAKSIIIKGVRSSERLLDETNLFLHRIETELPKEKQRSTRMSIDKEAVFREKKVLLVDDDMRNVFAIASVLEQKGVKIEVARNGLESLHKLDQFPDTDLVLMDIMMPQMDGYQAMEKIRAQQRFKDLPIIALTAKAMKGDKKKCIDAGANDYLAKPVDIDKLLSLLRVWLYK